MMQHHKYSLTELDNMIPWEREIYISLLLNFLKEQEEQQKEQEAKLLLQLHPDISADDADIIAEISSMTRAEMMSEAPKLSNAISTRLSVELAGLLSDGFTLEEGAEVAIYPFFDADGGIDSERTYMKQVVQKYCGKVENEDIFNTEEEELN